MTTTSNDQIPMDHVALATGWAADAPLPPSLRQRPLMVSVAEPLYHGRYVVPPESNLGTRFLLQAPHEGERP